MSFEYLSQMKVNFFTILSWTLDETTNICTNYIILNTNILYL